MFTVASDATLSVQAPLLRYCTNRVYPAKTYLIVSLFYYIVMNTQQCYRITVASDALLSVQAPSLRYYSNRVSPAKTYLLVSLFYYIVTNTQQTLRVYGCNNSTIRFISVVCPIL